MSIIAAVVLAMMQSSADATAMIAAEALARVRAATSIGADPCRAPEGEEIVVCARRESPYALPLYDPMDDDDASQAGGNRVRQMREVKEAASRCKMQGLPCDEAGINLFAVGGFVAAVVEALLGDDD